MAKKNKRNVASIARRAARKEAKKEIAKEDTLLESALAQVGITGWAGDLASRAIGGLLDAGTGLIPGAGGIISGAAHAGGLWSEPPKNHLSGKGMPQSFQHDNKSEMVKLSRADGSVYQAHVLSKDKTIFRSYHFPLTRKGAKNYEANVPIVAGGSLPQGFFNSSRIATTLNNEELVAFSGRVYIGKVLADDYLTGDMLLSMDLNPSSGLLRRTYLGKKLALYDRYSFSHAALLYLPTTSAVTDGGLLMATFADPDKSLDQFGEGDTRVNAGESLANACASGEFWCGHSLLCALDSTVKYQNQQPGSKRDAVADRLVSAGAVEAIAVDDLSFTTSPGVFMLDVEGIAFNPFPPPEYGDSYAAWDVLTQPGNDDDRFFAQDFTITDTAGAFNGGRLPQSVPLNFPIPDGIFDPLQSGPSRMTQTTWPDTNSWSKRNSLSQLGISLFAQDSLSWTFQFPAGVYHILTSESWGPGSTGTPHLSASVIENSVKTNESVLTVGDATNGGTKWWSADFECDDYALLKFTHNAVDFLLVHGMTLLISVDESFGLSSLMIRSKVAERENFRKRIAHRPKVHKPFPLAPSDVTPDELALLTKLRNYKGNPSSSTDEILTSH
jgi:hypothetical protein